eukprot:TRINITY_DN60359_c0_g1_i1.p1 TRINITY_DN60359_c0_g1~~TRINITY_DN60359_c0_g1_i1.p1  ORF type:complete len:499 (+),score=104.53 TRINITY_DN60359_c0_g1_i1:105-1499(+)
MSVPAAPAPPTAGRSCGTSEVGDASSLDMDESEMDDACALSPPTAPGPAPLTTPQGDGGPQPRRNHMRSLTAQDQCELFCGRRLRELIDRRTGHAQRFRPGEHLRASAKGTFAHHGVYTGNGGTVIHYCSDRGKKDPAGKMLVRETCFHMFVCARTDVEVEAVEYSEGGCFDRSHTMRLARQSLGKGEFSLLANNCEHFASWCKKGRGVSEQVDTVEEVGKGAVSVAGGAAGGGYVAAVAGSQTVPVVAGSPYLGTVAQNILQHTTLGGILSNSGVATSYVVVPATAATVGIGLAVGAVLGGIGYGIVGGIKALFCDDDMMHVSFCVLRNAAHGMRVGQDGCIDADDEGLPVYGPVLVEAKDREALLGYACSALPSVPAVAEAWWYDWRKEQYAVLPADLSALPRVLSVVLLLEQRSPSRTTEGDTATCLPATPGGCSVASDAVAPAPAGAASAAGGAADADTA